VSAPALEARGITVQLAGGEAVVENVDLHVGPAEIVGLVGESGSGKTTTALSVFGYQSRGLRMAGGEIAIGGERMGDERAFRAARGRLVSYVPQNPGTALNPSLRIAAQVEDMIRGARERERAPRARTLLERVGLPGGEAFARRYPHQLSGGQQQRVCIAASLAPDPTLLVLDEPTTGLDVVTQDRILSELAKLRDEQQVAMLYITHDLAVVAQIASRIAVMYAGGIVEQGPTTEILRRPRHPYTRGLIAATPDHVKPRVLGAMGGIALGAGQRPPGCAFAPRCPQRTPECEQRMPPLSEHAPGHDVRCIHAEQTPAVEWTALPRSVGAQVDGAATILEVQQLVAEHRGVHGEQPFAVRDVSFTLAKRACTAIVGESGSGKTTLARAIAGLHPPSAGRVLLDGHELPGQARKRTLEQRRRIQIVFQNPAEALNPRHTVGASVARPAQLLRRMDHAQAMREVDRLLEAVRLPAHVARRYPRELSGGERQRVAIARALAAGPEVLVCDEITSALDVSVQAVVLELLRELRGELNLSLIFISHDLGVVATIAEQVLVLENGTVCERGASTDVLGAPQDPYTQRLLAAAPSLSAAIEAWDAAEAG
jgi:peptide/nickel transport system ATP-binding protein